MIYISLGFYIFVGIALIFYYVFPMKIRWCLLLAANMAFYLLFCKTGCWILLGTILVSYAAALMLTKCHGNGKKLLFTGALLFVILPWFIGRGGNFIWHELMGQGAYSLIVPLGISFYTMQIIAYLTDVYRGDISPQKNLAKYALFITFFPQIIQGPIPRYQQLGEQLFCGHAFDEDKFTRGFYQIIWGFFLKLVVADKAAVIVNTVFDNYPAYSGGYIWLASVLYSIQLYTDFLACTTLARGVSLLFGIELTKNFERPYFAVSIKDFWRRWHISLSSWLRDYIYIPLGGNRKGKLRMYLNLLAAFLVSGIWHGAGLKYIVWGGMHGAYQIAGGLLNGFKEKAYAGLKIRPDSKGKRLLEQAGTFLLVNFAWILFRADTLRTGISMIKHMFSEFNPWIFFNDRIFTLGLEWKEMLALFLALTLLYAVEKKQENGISVSECVLHQRLVVRWLICMAGICAIVIFGTYGVGFQAQNFIYGGF
ncbi:MAG: MBOAT family protein [Roseburia sp.]|nr:MBOAT family protein [Roseburia sp.]